jgi:hypothetical protein
LHKLSGERWETAVIAVGPAILNVYVLTTDESTFAKPLVKRLQHLRRIFR